MPLITDNLENHMFIDACWPDEDEEQHYIEECGLSDNADILAADEIISGSRIFWESLEDDNCFNALKEICLLMPNDNEDQAPLIDRINRSKELNNFLLALRHSIFTNPDFIEKAKQ